MSRISNADILSPNKENFGLDALEGVATNRSKRAKWYSPCKSPLILANSPEPEIATLKLVHFAKTPRISFGNVKVGSSATERLLIQNPHQISQILTVEKLSSEKGFNLEAVELEKSDGQGRCINLGPNEEKIISIKWEPKEAGSCREVVAFRWDTVLRVQVIVFGTAVSPIKRKEKQRQMSVLCVSQKLNQNRSVKQAQVPTKLFTEPQKEDVILQNVAPVACQENACANEQDFRRGTFVVQVSRRKEPSEQKEVKHTTTVVADSGTGEEPQYGGIQNKQTSPKRKAEDVKANAAKRSKKTEKNPKNVVAKPQPKVTNNSKPTALKAKVRARVKVPAKGVAQTRLKLVKAPRTSIPRHPLPFAAKNMYYDERWIDKQERGFTSWLNFILTPPDDSDVAASGSAPTDRGDMVVGTNNARKSQPLAPSREDLSLRAYTAKRKMTRLRRSACLLYQSEPLICVIRRIEAEVEEGRIAIRADKKLHADLGIKRNVVEMILSYSPLWLRIGLEVVYGEILPVHSNSDTSGLCRFITDRLLGNPDIAKEFAHPKVPGLYGQGYEEQLCKFTLKKLLLLVLFLDKAKLTRLIDHDPCLFNKDASFKSSRSILLTFSRDYLKGEGDITKHLNFLGYSVTHTQTARDEYDYAVTKIAVDLRDGLRLTRVVELLTHNWQLSASLRVPAISRLQKIHNVEVFMNELKSRGTLTSDASGINPRHIVDGHREKTLSLLWQIIFNFQVNVLINEEQLKDEINFLQKHKKLQAQLVAALKFEDPEMLGLARGRRESMEEDIYFKSERLSLLLKWCRIVCSYYGMKVENFTVSFSDGRALCYILHHYHPSLLPLAMINENTTLTRNPGTDDVNDSDEEGTAMLDSWTACYSPGSGTNPVLERLKANEGQNFKILAQKVQALGGIPMMAKVSDMSHTIPDEKVVITYVSYLCTRLLDLREETRAARCIQVAWKKFRLRKQLSAKQEMVKAACVLQARAKGFIARCRFKAMLRAAVQIQKTYRGYRDRRRLRCFSDAARVISSAYKASKIGKKTRQEYLVLRSAVIVMQALVRGKQTRHLVMKMLSARLIQSVWRQYKAKHRFHQMKAAVLVLQTNVRGFLERKRYHRLRKATMTLQTRLRASIATRQERNTFLELKSKVTKLQAIYRGNRSRALLRRTKAVEKIQSFVRRWIARREFLQVRTVVVKIQSLVRGHQAKRRYQSIKESALLIQRSFRALQTGLAQRQRYHRLRRSCVRIQASFRGFIVRKRYMEQVQAATQIQARIRQVLAQRKYQRSRNSAVVIQRLFRGYLQTKMAQEYFRRVRQSTISLQANFRRYRCHKEFTRKRVAATVLQSHTRRWLTRNTFLSIKRSALVLQTHYRAWSIGRRQYLKYHFVRGAIITLQAAARGTLLRQQIQKQRQSSVVIQAGFRCFAARRRFQLVKKATVVLQCRYRALVQCRSEAARYKKIKHSVLVLQSAYRGYKARRYCKQLKCAVKIQAVYRGYVVRSQYASTRQAITTVQSAVRGYLARRRYKQVKIAAVLLQRKYRAIVQGRAQAALYQRKRFAVLVLQSACRGYKARRLLKKLRAVVKIQSVYRGFVARSQYSTKHKAIVTLQAAFRRYIAMKWYHAVQKATAVLQERFRAMVQGRRQARLYQRKRSAALVLQSMYRGYKGRQFLKELKAVVKIQSIYRGFVARAQYSIKRKAVIKLQAAFRGHVTLKRYKEVKKATAVLQERYRAIIEGRVQATLYQRKRSAVLVLQSMYRGYTAREYFKLLKAAVLIQASYRGFIARSKYKATRLSIIKVQSTVKKYLAMKHYLAVKRAVRVFQHRYRALVQARAAISSYQKIRHACVQLQAAFRGYKARKLFRQLRAAVKIQSVYRGFVLRSRYVASQKSAIKIQASIRRYLAVKRYSRLKWAAVDCQRRYRARIQGMRDHLAFHVKRGACLKLQATVRGLLCRKSFIAKRSAAVVLQTRYRALVEGRREKKHYCELKKATVRLQACVRGMQARELARRHRAARTLQSVIRMRRARAVYCEMRAAAIKIQSVVKMAQQRKIFMSLKRAVTAIQTRYRATLLAKNCHIQYHYTRGAIITIQAVARGYLLRQRMRRMNQSAVVIQAAYRCHLAQREYRLRRKATLTLQLHFRAFLLGRGVARNYERLGRAVRCIQSFYRGYKSRQHVRHVRAALHIQARYRGFAERSRFLRQKNAIIALQATVRGYLARTNYRNLLTAALLMQSNFRAQQEMKHHREKYLALRKASVTIQSAARGWAQRRRYLAVRRSALLIQRRYRATAAAEKQLATYTLLRQSCIKIQAVFRGWKAREFRKQILAAITMQKYFRMHLVRTRYQKIRSVVTRLQSFVRMKRASTRYEQLKRSVCLVQRRYRAKRSCEVARDKYLLMRQSAVVLQTHWRGLDARRVLRQRRAEYARQQQAALRIQQYFKSYKRMKKDCIEYHITRGAVISIQAVFRGYLTRKFTERQRSATTIQTGFRGMVARRRYLRFRTLVIRLQAMVRRNQASQRYKSMRNAAMVLQQKYRAKVAGQSSLRQYQRMRSAVILLQASFRCQRERATYKKLRNSAIVIQSFARMLKDRRDFCRMRSAATLIQTRYRALDLGRAVRRSYCCIRSAAITLQVFYRRWCIRRATRRARAALVIQTRYRAVIIGKSAREDFLRRKAAAVAIQSVYRGRKSRLMVHRIRAALSIQAAIRRFITRRRVKRIKAERESRLLRFSAAVLFHLSAIRIQRFFRQACAVALARQQINSVISIQLWWRSVLQRKLFLAVRRATATLQRAARRYLQTKRRAAITLQSYARVWLAKRYLRKMEKAALVIQALWRGYKVRSRVTSPEVKRARKRIASANSCATEPMKLCNRTRSALDYLLSCRNQTTILDALVSLELVTRLSSVCCEDVARGGALRVIYAVMRKCNRSLPHMEIIKHSVCILINVSKCPSTYRAVYEEPESIATLVELLSIFREKKSSIFPNTCFLLTLLVTHRRIRQDVLEMPKVQDTIRSIYNITERKYKLEAKKNKAKSRMSMTQPLPMVPPTPCKFTPHKPRRDWSKWLERVSATQDPLQAVKCLLKMLDPKFQG